MYALLSLLSCTTDTAPGACETLADRAADTCWAQRVLSLGPTDVDAVESAGAAISDPIVRGAAIDAWMREHGQAIPRERAHTVCELLEREARRVCVKRIDAAHLNR